MSRSWADMDPSSTTPLSPISPPPIPYRQPSYFVAKKQGSISPPISAPLAKSPPPAMQEEKQEEEDDGGWGEDADTSAHQKRMKKFQKKLGPPGVTYTPQTQRFPPPPPPPQQQQQQPQQQLQQQHNPSFQNRNPGQGQGQFQPHQQRESFRPPPFQTQRDNWVPPQQQQQQPQHYQQQSQQYRREQPQQSFQPQQQQQEQYAQAPSLVESDGPVVVNIPQSQPNAHQARNGNDYASQSLQTNSSAPTLENGMPPAQASPRSSSRNGQSINANSAALGRIQQLLGTAPKPRTPRPSTEGSQSTYTPSSQPAQTGPLPTPSTSVVPVQPASERGGAYTGPLDQRFAGEGMDSNRAVLANPKRWGAAPAASAPAAEEAKPEAVAPVPAETPAEVEQANVDEESDGGWGETTEAADMPRQKAVAELPAKPQGNGETPAKTENKEPSDGGWGEDAPTPTMNPTPISAPAPQKSAIGEWAAETQAGAPQEDMGPDGGWVTDPRVHHWIRSTTPVAQPPVIPSKAHQDPSFATSPPSNSAITDPSIARDRSIASDSPIAKLMDSAEYDTILPAFGYQEDPDLVHNEDVKRQEREDLNRQYRSEYKWKRDPHPAFSARFVNQRLLVKFPFPIRAEAVRPTMYDHFSKYGHIRVTWNHEPRTPDSADQVILAFDSSKAVDDCLADPTHTSCLVKSSALGRSDVVAVKIKVTRPPLHITAKTVYVKILGARSGDGDTEPSTPKMNIYGQPIPSLPSDIFIDAVPIIKRGSGKMEWWARVRPAQMSFEDVVSRSLANTGIRAEQVTLLDMSTRVPEKELIEKLGWYFSDVMGVVPHKPSNGWLINTSNAAPARSLMSEISKIPGLMARLATPAEDMIYRQATEAPEEETAEEPKEVAEAAQEEEPVEPIPAPAEPVQASQPAPALVEPPKPQAVAPPPALPSPVAPVTQQLPPPIQPTQTEPTSANLPLQKRLVPTYRGRLLREDRSGPVPKFYDDAAIFVSQLSKESETDSSLFRRFSQYGTVCGVVYRPEWSRSEFASAKVLFGSKAAADKALKSEHGADSFGSAVRVERRRVLPNDVQLEEKYVDEMGRAHSPTMASQYSPPLPPVEEDDSVIQPAPLVAAPPVAPAPAPMGLVWMPLPSEWAAQHTQNRSTSVVYALCATSGGAGELPAGLPPFPSGSTQAVESSSTAAATESIAPTASSVNGAHDNQQANGHTAGSVASNASKQPQTSQDFDAGQPSQFEQLSQTIPSHGPPSSDHQIDIQSPRPVPTGPARQFNHSSQYQGQGQGPNGNGYNRYPNGGQNYGGHRDYPHQQSFLGKGQGPNGHAEHRGPPQDGGRWQHDNFDGPSDGDRYNQGGRGGYGGGHRGSYSGYNNHYGGQGRGGSGGYSNHGGSNEGRGYNDFGSGQGGMGRGGGDGGGGVWFGRGGRGGGPGPGSGSDRGRY